MQVLGGPCPVVPRMAQKDVPNVRQRRSPFDVFADRRECPHLCSCVRHGRTGSRPFRPCAAAGYANAAPRRRIRRGRVRPVAAITAITATATACRAGCSTARRAMTVYWCCASCHVVILLFVITLSSSGLSNRYAKTETFGFLPSAGCYAE